MIELGEANPASGGSNGDRLSEDVVISKLEKMITLTWCGTHWDIFNDLKWKFTNDGKVKDEIEDIKRRIKGFYDTNNDSPYIQDIIIETLITMCEIIIRSRKAPNGRPKTLEHICREVVRRSAPDEAEEIIKGRIHSYIASAVIVDD